MSGTVENHAIYMGNGMNNSEEHRPSYNKDVVPTSDLWTDGLLCAFEFIKGRKRTVRPKGSPEIQFTRQISCENLKHAPVSTIPENSSRNNSARLMEPGPLIRLTADQTYPFDEHIGGHAHQSEPLHTLPELTGSHWVPIGWTRISELVQTVQSDAGWSSQQEELIKDDDDRSVADLAAPYWERPAGPIWWCHVAAGHQYINKWLKNAQWLHPAISIALRDESRLISEKMKHLLYEVPVRVAGGLLFELLGQSAGDPFVDEDDIPIVLRSWQAQNFLITSMHVKAPASVVNVLGISEVQEFVYAGGDNAPKTVHEVIALLASRLARWDDRLFRKSIFGAADEAELKFMDKRNHEDMNLFSVILNQEIRKLSRQVIRVKWSLHAREEIVFELLQHIRGSAAKSLLESIRKSTREMIEEQEAVRGRLFTIQDVMQGTVRSWLQDRSLRVTHNLAVFGGCGLVLSVITGLFGINVDGMPGANNTPYAFALFTGILIFIGILLIAVGTIYLGLKKPITEKQVAARKHELQQLVKTFQHEAETHAQVKRHVLRNNIPPTAGDLFFDESDYVMIH